MRFLAVALALLLPACHVFEPEGRRQTTTFTTFLAPDEVRSRAASWLAERGLYDVVASDPRFVRGEKRRPRSVGPGEQVDVQTVSISSVIEGSRVEVQALTYLLTARGEREQADQLSPEAGADHVALVRVLNPVPF
jgi:hypothetical protein